MTFKRMQEFGAYGVPLVAYALQQAAEEEGKDPLLALSEDGANVKRQRPLEPNSTAWSRSVYVVSFRYPVRVWPDNRLERFRRRGRRGDQPGET